MTMVRTRFAPSPTGYLHVGGLRTALYAYLLAKKHNGSFILRIEDTDQARTVQGAVENIINTLRWAGLECDEGPHTGGPFGPYTQSERLALYKKHALELIEKGHAYYCFCSSERLSRLREVQIASKQPPAYDRHCRDLSPEVVEKRLAAGEPHVIRMKVPLEGECVFKDSIRDEVRFAYKVVDDQVIIKSDGFPTYHLAVAVDDHFMQVSHVIRGEEWLPSTPKHLLLYQYFGWQAPQFAHLPLLLNLDRSKLSKRQGDVAVEDYRAKGYLRDALINFVALLGWNPGEGDTREIFSMDDLIREFSLERVNKSGAVFNIEKLDWLNEQYIHHMSEDALLVYVKPLMLEHGVVGFADEYVKQVIALMKERATVLHDFVVKAGFFFADPTSFDEKSKAKNWGLETGAQMQSLAERFETLSVFDAQSTEQALRDRAEALGINAGKLIHPLRLALTGVGQGPSLFHLIEVLGKETCLRRLSQAIKVL